MFKNIKIDLKYYVCTVSYIRIFLHKSKVKDHKEIFYCYFYRFHYAVYKATACFFVAAWMRSKSYQVVSQEFSENFSERNFLNKTTISKYVKKYREEGTSLNLNRGRSGRRRTARSEENIANVRYDDIHM